MSSLGSRLSLGLSVLWEGGGVDSEWGGVSPEGGGVPGELSCRPLVVGSVGGGGGVTMAAGGSEVRSRTEGGVGVAIGVTAGSVGVGVRGTAEMVARGLELCRSPSPREREESLGTNEGVFSTRRHCMTLVSFPPVDTK